ncbi:P-type conjugative transfer protein TrbJ [Agrobacterium tumefaciens]|uniref:P-type conjugative transfer protein TrbJ n=1 Tax=Agrobacterium tumefaciens TaxID=358 RepID=UPI0015737302|nr:P-type conjugative transfer protein TrbJ [Agrobacterium tumefaciens]NTB05921.1 P-type conjugative transfer protein TrbJ [Agrobacterium tumefaciens]
MKRFITILCLVAAHGLQQASAGAVVGATEFTQIANNIQLAAQYAEQAQQTVHQLNQYKAMLKNLETTTSSSTLDAVAGALWEDQKIASAFQNLQTIVVNGQKMGFSMSNQDAIFQRLHPGYSGAFDSKNTYREWSDNTHAAVRNSMALAGIQSESLNREGGMVRELQSRSRSADGQMKALQAGNDIGIAMIGQMQQMRQLQMAQMNAQEHFMLQETSRADESKKSSKMIYGNLRSTKVVQGNKTVPADAN